MVVAGGGPVTARPGSGGGMAGGNGRRWWSGRWRWPTVVVRLLAGGVVVRRPAGVVFLHYKPLSIAELEGRKNCLLCTMEHML
ncbi:hypothetical protein Q3G72_027528 [Acer saccharum]|nr:hypothetical protein Q3G72_027528 [Acer saccharum]